MLESKFKKQTNAPHTSALQATSEVHTRGLHELLYASYISIIILSDSCNMNSGGEFIKVFLPAFWNRINKENWVWVFWMLKTALEDIYHCLSIVVKTHVLKIILLSSSETCTIYCMKKDLLLRIIPLH